MYKINQVLSKNKSTVKIERLTSQQGNSLILALFIIIILSLLGGVLMRVLSTSSEAISQEVLGTRAYMAANSAMQAELYKIFPRNRVPADYCNADTDVSYDLGEIPGFLNCSARVTCTNYFTRNDNNEDIRYYRLTSQGVCGGGVNNGDSAAIESQRTIQVEARGL